MEKNITLGTSADINFVVNSISNGSKSVVDGSKNLISSIKSLLQSGKQPIEWLQSYYSIIATQFTFVLGILPADINLALRAAFLGSFAFCLHLCKKSFQEEI